MSHGELPIDDLLTRLRLTHSQRVWRDTAMRAANEEWSYQEFLAVLLLQELNHRQVMHTNHLQQLARFPFQKTVAEFEFEWATPQARMVIDSCLDRGFIAEGRSLLLLGGGEPGQDPPCRGGRHAGHPERF